MIYKGTNFEDIEDKASQLMDRKILDKIKAANNQLEFVQLINVHERYKQIQISDLPYEWPNSE